MAPRVRVRALPTMVARPAVVLATLAMGIAGCSSSSEDGSPTTTDAEQQATAPGTSTSTTASPACGTTEPPPTLDVLSVTVDDTTRTTKVHLPPGWDGQDPVPVVVAFHGATSDPPTMALMDGLDAKADSEEFIVLRPQAAIIDVSEDMPQIAAWDLTGSQVDDLAFVAAALDELGRTVCTDPSRVFATGFSIGGEMSMAAACGLPDRIAAFAPVAASRDVPCDEGVPRPAIAFHGTDDRVSPYGGVPDAGLPPVEETMAAQAARNGCEADPAIDEIAPTVATLTWTGCTAPTVLYRLDEHGHSWPGHPLPVSRELVVTTLQGTEEVPNPVPAAMGLTVEEMADNVLLTNTEIDATDLMWDFFMSNS